MVKQISALSGNGGAMPTTFATTGSGRGNSFQNVLEEQQVRGLETTQKPKVFVGEITSEKRTVSELLMQNDQLKKSTWDILSLPVNKEKDYTKLQADTRVYFNPNDGSLSWPGQGGAKAQRLAAGTDAVVSSPTQKPLVSPTPKATVSTAQKAIVAPTYETTSSTTPKPTSDLGVLSKDRPTVSHLLKAHPDYGNKTWEILAQPVNRNKDFTSIRPGTQVSFNPNTQEITWKGSKSIQPSQPSQPTQPFQAADNTDLPPAEDLTEAVKPFLGASYKDMDCYELLVKGLKNMDIPYGGKNGLYSKLTSMAQAKGMPENAYLNGEGIVKAAGSLVLSKQYNSVGNWQKESASFYGEMEPLLNKGQILSFSTERRGHTGIISQQDEGWTFINSGKLDNTIKATTVSQGVGEESLKAEINNWFKLAQNNKESLVVTLGKLDQQKEMTAYNQSQPNRLSEQI